jgi:hypothetical protein
MPVNETSPCPASNGRLAVGKALVAKTSQTAGKLVGQGTSNLSKPLQQQRCSKPSTSFSRLPALTPDICRRRCPQCVFLDTSLGGIVFRDLLASLWHLFRRDLTSRQCLLEHRLCDAFDNMSIRKLLAETRKTPWLQLEAAIEWTSRR